MGSIKMWLGLFKRKLIFGTATGGLMATIKFGKNDEITVIIKHLEKPNALVRMFHRTFLGIKWCNNPKEKKDGKD